MIMKLHDLKPQEGSKKGRKRVGRGISAGQGKTAGRGTKGQGARAGGGTPLYHQGGNLPFFRRLPFVRGKGFTPLNTVEYNEINLDQLADFAADSAVTPESLAAARLLRDPGNPVVILGRGEVNVALKVRVHRISKAAQAKIEAAGGSVEIVEVE
jgi:large subunit ribosomal protein L15